MARIKGTEIDKGIKPLRSYVLKFREEEDLNKFNEFQKAIVFNNQTVVGAILEMVDVYLAAKFPKTENGEKIELVTETELINKSKLGGILISRSAIRTYKKDGLLQDTFGTWWYSNPDGSIVYEFEKVFQYIKKRKENPKSKK